MLRQEAIPWVAVPSTKIASIRASCEVGGETTC